MLTTLATVKTRLSIDEFDLTHDTILTNAINAISYRFEKETNRTLARTTATTDEFFPDQKEISVRCYPIETVTKFELKENETDGWIEQTGVEYLLRNRCILSLRSPFSVLPSPEVARATYTGG